MPHVSKNLLEKETLNKLDNQIFGFLTKTSSATRKKIFTELFTKTERLMFGKRLALVYLIDKGVSTHTISNVLKMSLSTVARFEVALGGGLFLETKKWISGTSQAHSIIKLLLDLS